MSGRLVEVELAWLLAEFGILFGLLEQLIEFTVQHLALILFGVERFAEDLFAPSALAFEFGDSGGQILDGRGLDRLFVGNHRTQGGVDFQFGLAAGAGNCKEFAGHVHIIYDSNA